MFETPSECTESGPCEILGEFKSIEAAIARADEWADNGGHPWTLSRISPKDYDQSQEEGEMPNWVDIAFRR